MGVWTLFSYRANMGIANVAKVESLLGMLKLAFNLTIWCWHLCLLCFGPMGPNQRGPRMFLRPTLVWAWGPLIAQTNGDLTFLLGPLWFGLEDHRLAQTKGDLTCFLRPLWFGLDAHRCPNNFTIKTSGFQSIQDIVLVWVEWVPPIIIIHPSIHAYIHPSIPLSSNWDSLFGKFICCWFSTPNPQIKKNQIKMP